MKDLGQVSFYIALPLINGNNNEVEWRAQLYRKDLIERVPLKLYSIMNLVQSERELLYESKIVVLGTRCFGLTRAQIKRANNDEIGFSLRRSVNRPITQIVTRKSFSSKALRSFLERVKDARISKMPLASLENVRVGQGTR